MSQEVMVMTNESVRYFVFYLNRRKTFTTKYLLVVIEWCRDVDFQGAAFPALIRPSLLLT